MAKFGTLNFQCPQFVDFAACLDGSSKDDVFFDCDDSSPGTVTSNAISTLKTPNASQENKLSEGTENRLLNKMTAAMAILDNTPGIKKVMTSKKSQRNHIHEFNSVTTLKPNIKSVSLFPSKLQRSKSIAAIDKISEDKQRIKKNRELGMRKRSSSLGDLKNNKKQTYPMTPMCLKRTKFKSKSKIKTTEEIELEEIAKLQKQLKQHLRFNEISMKKLRLKPRDYMAGKNAQLKVDNNLKSLKEGEKDMKLFVDKVNVAPKEVRPIIQKVNSEAGNSEFFRNPTISSRMHSIKATDNIPKPEVSVKPRNPPSVLATKNIAGPSSSKDDKEPILYKNMNLNKKFGFHTGVSFPENIKKFTVVKPFSFDAKNKNVKQRTAYDQKLDIWSNPLLKMNKDKENIPISKVQPLCVRKPESKGIYQPPTARKLGESRSAIQTRGLAVADNFARRN